MGRHAGLLLGVGLTLIVAQLGVIAGFWFEWQRAAHRSQR